MFDTFQSRLTVAGYLVADSALRVGTGRVSAITGSELPVIRDARGRPFIPGSSFKGALRSHLESLVRGQVPQGIDLSIFACDPTDEHKQCVQPGRIHSENLDWEYPKDRLDLDKPVGVGDLRQGLDDPGENQDQMFTERLLANTCLICQTFGSPWLASPVRVRDMPVVTREWFGQFDTRDGVAIDRDKGTAADGKLYNYEVVPAGTRFELHITAENLADWQRGLLWLGLQALERGDVPLGGFTSRGLGWVRLDDPQVHLVEGAQALIDLLGGAEAGEKVDDEKAKTWVKAFHAKLNGKGAQHA